MPQAAGGGRSDAPGRSFPPLAGVLRAYRRADLRDDAIAGLTVWAAAVPSGLAYAGLAGLPPVVGLYASVAAGLAYALFGSSRQAQVGPTSTSSILTAAAIAPLAHGDAGRAIELAELLALLVAAILLVAWALKLGFVADFLSRPVLIGFTAAVSLVIIAAQLPSLLGVQVTTRTFQTTVSGLAGEAGSAQAASAAIGVGVIVAILALKRLAPRLPRELIVVAGATVAVAALGLEDTVRVVGDVPTGLPAPRLPSFSWEDVRRLVAPAAGIALIAFVETMAIGRTFARRHRYPVEPRDELLALGAGNLAAGVLQGYPGDASFAQSALGDEAGARTIVSSIVAKAAILLTLLLLTPLFADLPYPALAGVVIAAVVGFVDVPAFRRLVRFQRAAQRSRGQPATVVPRQPEAWAAAITFAGTLLFGLLNGILVGVIVTLLGVLHRAARPRVSVLGKVPGAKRHRDVSRHPDAKVRPGVLIVRLEGQLFFANADYFHQAVTRLVYDAEHLPEAVVVVCDAMTQVDVTGIEMLADLIADLHEHGIEVRFCRVKGPVIDAFAEAGIVELVGARHFYDSVRAAKKGRDPDGLPLEPRPAGRDGAVEAPGGGRAVAAVAAPSGHGEGGNGAREKGEGTGKAAGDDRQPGPS